MLTFKDKIIYGSAGMGDSATYSIVGTFLMFFLTTVAGVSPAIAGTITAVGSVWDAVCSPFVGYISDNCSHHLGRRRPFLLWGSLPLAISTMFLFTKVGDGGAASAVYYTIIIIVFWTAFSFFFGPYLAFGAEYTTDYNERTRLRAYASVCNILGGMVGGVLPSLFVDKMTGLGLSAERSWQFTALFVGFVACAAILVTFFGSKGKDKTLAQWREELGIEASDDDQSIRIHMKKMVSEYVEVFRIKPLQLLIVTSIFALLALTIFHSDKLYYFTYNMGLDGAQTSLLLFFTSVCGFAVPPVVNKVSERFDKRIAYIAMVIMTCVVMILFRLLPFSGIPIVMVLLFFFAFANTGYWQLMPALLYDLCEYDEYMNGKQRGASLMSIQALAEAAATAIAMQVLGIILQMAGFDGSMSTQSPLTMVWIENCMTLIPIIFLLIAGFAIYKYPITKEVFLDIQKKLAEGEVNNGKQ